MKKAILVFAVLAASTAANAISYYDSNLTFLGRVTLDNTAGSATQVTSWVSPMVGDADGIFSGLSFGDAVSFSSPWYFNSGPIANFWSVGGFSFDLNSSFIDSQVSGAVTVQGSGNVSGNGYSDLPGSWEFSTQNPSANGRFTFSSASSTNSPRSEVPDSGSTGILLGLSILAFVGIRKLIK